MRLEEPFWDALQEIAIREKRSIGSICSAAARMRDGNLTSAVRVYVLEYWRRPRVERYQTTARSRSAPERSTETN